MSVICIEMRENIINTMFFTSVTIFKTKLEHKLIETTNTMCDTYNTWPLRAMVPILPFPITWDACSTGLLQSVIIMVIVRHACGGGAGSWVQISTLKLQHFLLVRVSQKVQFLIVMISHFAVGYSHE